VLRALIYVRREAFLLAFQHPKVARVAQRAALRHLHKAVKDRALRRKLTPTFTMGCKRVLLSNDYLPAVTQANVELVTEGIASIREHSVIDAAGVERQVDAIIFGTGFQPTTPPLARHVHGRAGLRLADVWTPSPTAHLGTTVTGFPNLFVLLGPNTGLGHTSVIYMIEAQIDHFLRVLRFMRQSGFRAIEPRPEAQARFVEQVDRRMQGTVWVAGGCASWYLDSSGRNSTLWPDFTWRFRRRLARVDARDFITEKALAAQRTAVGA
jgi:cation diffusion facilitator CzcD-associated flavoprotein CzcO